MKCIGGHRSSLTSYTRLNWTNQHGVTCAEAVYHQDKTELFTWPSWKPRDWEEVAKSSSKPVKNNSKRKNRRQNLIVWAGFELTMQKKFEHSPGRNRCFNLREQKCSHKGASAYSASIVSCPPPATGDATSQVQEWVRWDRCRGQQLLQSESHWHSFEWLCGNLSPLSLSWRVEEKGLRIRTSGTGFLFKPKLFAPDQYLGQAVTESAGNSLEMYIFSS